VVYLGRIVEIGPAADVITDPRHPYTKALVSVIPVPEAGHATEQILLTGETPSPTSIPPGCRFAPRCWLRREKGDPPECTMTDPSLLPEGGGHAAACHFA
jgi:oligopeptide/dipeptide ABC transporter ATP-binding protein